MVFEELAQAERARAELVSSGASVWDARPYMAGYQVAVWNAFVLQTLGAGLLDADYAADAGTHPVRTPLGCFYVVVADLWGTGRVGEFNAAVPGLSDQVAVG